MPIGCPPSAVKRLVFAVRNPVYALRALGNELTWSDERFLALVTGRMSREIREYLREPLEERWFLDHLRRCENRLRGREASADFYAKGVRLQYAVVRALKPALLVETGVANGVSTSYLLLALEKNRRGHLHSIEIGTGSCLSGEEVGWIVPDSLASRWSLHLGDSRVLLPALLEQLRTIDVFIHDSLHTYQHMMFEFRAAFPHLAPSGVLLADDVTWNGAFRSFGKEVRVRHADIIRGVGVLRK